MSDDCCDCRYYSFGGDPGRRESCLCACHDESVGCCSLYRRCENPYHRSGEWPGGHWPCSFNASPDRNGARCEWYVAITDEHRRRPYRMGPRCEEHACLSCGEFPCRDDCHGEQLYDCARCRKSFLRFEISRVGAADLCRACARDPMGDLRGR